MRAQPVDLIGGYYKDDSLPWAAQDTVNWLPVAAEVSGTRTVKKFSTPPGLKPYQEIGTGPIRGMHDCEGLRLIVSGRYLYRITNAGVGVPLGVIPGVGRVQMTHNQFSTGFQVLVENGQGGGGYVYTTATDTFAKITDEGYPGSISSDYLDSYILGVEPQGRFWFHSNLADATDYNTLDRYEAEAAPDRIVGLAVSASEVVVFGQRTTEFYYNSGAQTGTFQNRRSSITRGCASRHTIQKLDNTLFWLGDDGVVYRLDGYLARPVSTRPLEKEIADYNWPEAIAYVWEDRGHKVYYLTFPDGQTFGYDVITGLWHRRESFGMDRWRLSHIINWGRDWFGGDFQVGRIWQLDWDYFLEGDQPIISERISPVLSDDQSQLILPNAELIFDTGQGPGTEPIPFPAQPVPPSLSGDAPDALRNAAYAGYTYTITGGQSPFAVTLVGGALPPGMSVSNAGTISGTPTALGNYTYTLRVTDKDGLWTELNDSIGVVTQVISLGRVAGGNPAVTRRNLDATWSNVNSSAASGSVYLIGVPAGRFLAWLTGAAYYSDDNGSNWTKTVTVIDSTAANRTGDNYGGVVVLGGAGVCYVSTNNGTTYTSRAAPSSFFGSVLIVKSGPNAGRILMLQPAQNTTNAYSDNQGVSFVSCQAHGVNRQSGGASHSDANFQYIGGNVAAGGKPRLGVMQEGSTLVRNLTLSGAANGIITAIFSHQMGSATRLLIGTSTGELWASDDAGVSAFRLPFTSAGSVNGIVFDGARLIVGTATSTNMIQVSTNNGATWSPETNPSTGGITALAGLP